MRLAGRLIAIVVVLALASLGIWRTLMTGMSDHLAAEGESEQALNWDSNNPAALAALAGQQRDQGNLEQAAENARALLQREPLNGQGFIILADIAEAGSNKAEAMQMSTVVLVPRKRPTRSAWTTRWKR